MTFDEIEFSLPNGFHDAFLCTLTVDYVSRTAGMEIEVWVGHIEPGAFDRTNPADYLRREGYRRGRLGFSGLLLLTSEVPNHALLTDENHEAIGLGIDTVSANFASFAKQNAVEETLPEGAFLCAFVFTNDANSFLHIAADHAEWTWLSEPRTIY